MGNTTDVAFCDFPDERSMHGLNGVLLFQRAANELCSHQKKIYELDTHAGVSIAGLLSDGRILA